MSIEKLQKALKDETLIYGENQTMSGVKKGTVHTIFLAKDCKVDTRDSLKEYAKHTEIDLIELDISGQEIAAICKRQHSISILSY